MKKYLINCNVGVLMMLASSEANVYKALEGLGVKQIKYVRTTTMNFLF